MSGGVDTRTASMNANVRGSERFTFGTCHALHKFVAWIGERGAVGGDGVADEGSELRSEGRGAAREVGGIA